MSGEEYSLNYQYPDERQSLRLKQLASIGEGAGFSNPDRVAENANILLSSSGEVSRESYKFEPTRHSEGLRRALWTLNTYKLSINKETGIYNPDEPERDDWELSEEEKRSVRISLERWDQSDTKRKLASLNDDLVSMYTHEIKKVPLLKPEEEVELAKQIEAGLYAGHKLEGGKANQGQKLTDEERQAYTELVIRGKDAFEHFYRANLPLVVSVAKKFAGTSMPLIDIIQEGNLGLWHAVEKFDYTKGYKFSTYARNWIMQSITHTLPSQTANSIPLTEYVWGNLSKLKKAWEDHEFEIGRAPNIDSLMERSGLCRKVVQELFVHIHSPLSLDAVIYSNTQSTSHADDTSNLTNHIYDDEMYAPHSLVTREDTQQRLWYVINTLNEEERGMIVARYGLDGNGELTIEQVGRTVGVGREVAARKLKKILEKMRLHSEIQGL